MIRCGEDTWEILILQNIASKCDHIQGYNPNNNFRSKIDLILGLYLLLTIFSFKEKNHEYTQYEFQSFSPEVNGDRRSALLFADVDSLYSELIVEQMMIEEDAGL